MPENEWKRFDKAEIEKTHGSIYFYRDLYNGYHSKIFKRAKDLIEKGEIVDNIIYGQKAAQNVTTPYIVANISKIIAEIPAMFVSRSIGKIESSLHHDRAEEPSPETIDDMIDAPDNQGDMITDQIVSGQQEIISQIEKNSNLHFEHWGNIVQNQIDGGLVGVPWKDERGLRVDFKARDVYFPHDDDLGADLVYEIEIDGDEYLHVYRERVEQNGLITKHLLYSLNEQRETSEIDTEEAAKILGIKEMQKKYIGRKRPFIVYWPNEKTIMNPLGVSALKNQEGKQDDINWTLTRNAITFERNGKPRIAVSPEIMRALQENAMDRYGDPSKIDHRDLEITTFDDNGRAMEVIQIDISKIGDISWVKDLMKLMLMETKTSERALDFYLDGGGSSYSQSGIAKFYDLFTSMMKAEQIQKEYIFFIQDLFESALWLANNEDPDIVIEEPEIALKSMIPISRKELIEENKLAFEGSGDQRTQSLETTVRRNNPNASEEWIHEELTRIEAEKSDDDSFSLLSGRQSLQQFMDNRDEDGTPLDEEGNPVEEEGGTDEA